MLTLEVEETKNMSTDRPATFAEWLDSIKNKLGLEQDRQLAEHIGLSPEVLSYLYSGRRAPTAMHIETISSSLKLVKRSNEYCELLDLAQEARLSMEKSQRRNNIR